MLRIAVIHFLVAFIYLLYHNYFIVNGQFCCKICGLITNRNKETLLKQIKALNRKEFEELVKIQRELRDNQRQKDFDEQNQKLTEEQVFNQALENISDEVIWHETMRTC